MHSYMLLALSCFSKVFLSALQTKNLQKGKLLATALTSMAMSTADFMLIKQVARSEDMTSLLVVIVCNTLGVTIALAIHDKLWEAK